jgi:hypothetical protein
MRDRPDWHLALAALGALVALVALGACYEPLISAGAPCDPERGNCPRGQRCLAMSGGNFCLTSDPIADAPVADAPDPVGYRAIVLADRPIGYWRLGDTTAMAADASGNGTAGIYGSGITQGVPGAVVNDADTAADFDGNTGVITIGSGFDFTGKTAFSIEAWIRPTLFDGVFRHVVTKQRRDTPRQGYALLVQADDGIKFERFVNDMDISAGVVITPPATAYTHVVASYDGAVIRLFINGQQVRQIVDNRIQPPIEGPAVIGAANLTEAFFAGSIDEVAIYAAALPPARVEAHFLAGTVP